MSMSKKDFVALADDLADFFQGFAYKPHTDADCECVNVPSLLGMLADFCEKQNPAFKRERWLKYIAGECGPNGGKR